MENFILKGWRIGCRLSRIFLVYFLIYQQIFLSVVWATGDLIRIEISHDHLPQKHGSYRELTEERFPLKLKITRQDRVPVEQEGAQSTGSILYENKLHFKREMSEAKTLSPTSTLHLASTHTDGALNLIFKEKGLNLRFLIRPTGEVSIEILRSDDAIELYTTGRITTGLSPIKATFLSRYS